MAAGEKNRTVSDGGGAAWGFGEHAEPGVERTGVFLQSGLEDASGGVGSASKSRSWQVLQGFSVRSTGEGWSKSASFGLLQSKPHLKNEDSSLRRHGASRYRHGASLDFGGASLEPGSSSVDGGVAGRNVGGSSMRLAGASVSGRSASRRAGGAGGFPPAQVCGVARQAGGAAAQGMGAAVQGAWPGLHRAAGREAQRKIVLPFHPGTGRNAPAIRNPTTA